MKAIQRFHPENIFYPACGDHLAPSELLGGSTQITYLDPDAESIKKVTQGVLDMGLEDSTTILNIPLNEYSGNKDFDMVIMQNAHYIHGLIGDFIPSGAIVVANNYFGTQDAETFLGNETEYTLIGVETFDGEYIDIIEENKEDYTKIIETNDLGIHTRKEKPKDYFFRKK